MGNFTVGGWNTGKRNDYLHLLPEAKKVYQKENLKDNLKSQKEALKNSSDPKLTELTTNIEKLSNQIEIANRALTLASAKIEKRYNEAFENIAKSANVLCLQEVDGEQNLPEVLLENNFAIFSSTAQHTKISGKISETLIAIDTKKFDSFEIKSDEKDFFPIILAKEIATGKKFLFCSVHVSGMPIAKKDEKIPDALARRTKQHEANRGDEQIGDLVEKLKGLEKECAGIIIAGDFNVDPSRGANTFDRFKILKEAGYEICSTGNPTNKVSYGAAARGGQIGDPENDPFHTGPDTRQLDHFAVKIIQHSSLFGRVKKFIFREGNKKGNINALRSPGEAKVFEPGFDPRKNVSDHIPIYLQFQTFLGKSFSDQVKDIFFKAKKL